MTRSADAAAWSLVVPVKRLDHAKSRLGAYGDEARRALALAFASDVTRAAAATGARVVVVTDDDEVRAAVTRLGARVTPDVPGAGIDAAVVHGAGVAGGGPIAVLSADLPAARAEELAAALGRAASAPRSFARDLAGTGTTLLCALDPHDLRPSYGVGSADRHAASGAVPLEVAAGLRCDVDRPEDLDAARALGVGPATAAALQRWCA